MNKYQCTDGPLKIGIYGGSFDPIHMGHIQIAKAALRYVDKVFMIPTDKNPLKENSPHAGNALRSMWIDRALATECTILDDISHMRLVDSTFLIDSIIELRKELGSEVELYFILGSDAAAEVDHWKEAINLHKFVKFIVFPRIGDTSSWEEVLRHNEIEWILADTSIGEISSTDIRNCISVGYSIQGAVPEAIRECIEEFYG